MRQLRSPAREPCRDRRRDRVPGLLQGPYITGTTCLSTAGIVAATRRPEGSRTSSPPGRGRAPGRLRFIDLFRPRCPCQATSSSPTRWPKSSCGRAGVQPAVGARPSAGRDCCAQRSITADLHSDDDRPRCTVCCARPTSWSATMRPAAAARLGLHRRAARARYPRLVAANDPGWGTRARGPATRANEARNHGQGRLLPSKRQPLSGPGSAYVRYPYASFAAAQTAVHGISPRVRTDSSGPGRWWRRAWCPAWRARTPTLFLRE